MIWPLNRSRMLRNLFPEKKTPAPRRRAFSAAALNRLTNDWATQPQTADAELLPELKTLRARSRNLANNNDYARRFISMAKTNVIGGKGIILQNKAKKANGEYDSGANQKIEEAWGEWGKMGSCTSCGCLTWVGVQQMVFEAVARDGECLIIKVADRTNPYGFTLQIIESDHLDEDLNRARSERANEIRGGIELNRQGRPIAYHLFEDHPGGSPQVYTKRAYRRLPASAVIHVFRKERASQTRGVPWLATPGLRLKMLDGYEEAELVAARTAAAKMGFFTSQDGESYVGDDLEDDYTPITEAEPGTFEQLPQGMDFKTFDPEHPVSAFADFEKAILRGVASGLNVSYVSLANDLEGVSYSSIRQGELADRDNWRLLQQWFIDQFIMPVYDSWVQYALMSGKIAISADRFNRLNVPTWQARGWQWVDPAKEIKASAEAVNNRLKTRTAIAGEQGEDIEDIFETLAKEQKLADKYGLILPTGDTNGKENEDQPSSTEPDA